MRSTVGLTALVICLLLPVAQASQFNVSPVKVTLPARAKSTSVTVTNNGKKPVLLGIKLYAWSKQAGRDQLSPDEDLVVTPPILKLEPGRAQTVRIGRPGEIPVPEIEKSYRLIVTELASPNDEQRPGAGLALHALLEISVPLFVPPAKPVKHLEWSLSAGSNGQDLVLSALNTGTVHSKITKLRLLDRAGVVVAESAGLFYALPQQHGRPALTFVRQPRPAEPLRLEYLADHAARAAELKAPGP